MNNDWLMALNDCKQQQEPCVLVTVVAVEGSLPRAVGSKMLVTAEHFVGSVGGSHIELQALRRARQLLNQGGVAVTETVLAAGNDHDSANEHCDGSITLLFEPLFVNPFNIFVFGAGHVGKALLHVLTPINCQITWVDSRDGIFPVNIPDSVNAICATQPADIIVQAPAHSYFVLFSHSHEQDFAIGERVLARGDADFFGMIGSSRKRQQFEQRMLAKGFALADIKEQLVCPLGMPGLKGRQPAEIAVSIAAQLLQVRYLSAE